MARNLVYLRLSAIALSLLLVIPDSLIPFSYRWPVLLLGSGILGLWSLVAGVLGLRKGSVSGVILLAVGGILCWFTCGMVSDQVSFSRWTEVHEAMLEAVRQDDAVTLDGLLSQHPEKRSALMKDLFLQAVREGHPKVVVYLLDHGIDINGTLEELGRPPILNVAIGPSIAKPVKAAMIERVKDVDMRATNGQSALHLAAATGDRDAVALLLARGADPKLEDYNHKTPIFVARERHQDEIERMLVGR